MAKYYSSKPCAFCGRSFWPVSSMDNYCSLKCACLSCVHIRGADECWPWVGSANAAGYGHFKFRGPTKSSHRVICESANGPVPKGLCVLHHCDNPPCCNPSHLFIGTYKDNRNDCITKKRAARLKGEINLSAKLTDESVRGIRASSKNGVELARLYGVSKSAISLIKLRKTWTHVS